ncbi:BA14K family protein [Agrobacterium albertimagni AOL15]|uniref:Lectin-like protein BA14k n=2 Tax=Agrobacterium albertimagni TaxID=147266 RepID=K2QR74_9HYPH|nr:BA14K family protein [Agrobacterium albertimagni AOL15]
MEIPMKPVIKLLSASALAAGMVIGGVVLASAALAPEEDPHRFTGLDIKDLWTMEPVRIDRTAQNLERLPPRYASHVVMVEPDAQATDRSVQTAASERGSEVADIDILVTAAIDEPTSGFGADTLPPEHFSWCEARYRSYDPVRNTYRSFSGETRPCDSPYQVEVMAELDEGDAQVMTVSAGGNNPGAGMENEGHVMACMERYRSYRPSDNTYQPYGGGPRQPCQLASF